MCEKNIPLLDMHCDTIWQLAVQKQPGDLMDNTGCVSIEKLQRAGSIAQFFACFVYAEELEGDTPEEKYEHGYGSVLEMCDYLKKQEEKYPDEIALTLNYEQLEKHQKEGRISAFLTVEEGGILCGKIERLDELYRKGIRLITPLWNYENCIGHPNSKDREQMQLGLKPFGIEAAKRMEELGIIIDVSHASDGTFWDLLKYTEKPLVASHSNCREFCAHPRNLSDEMIRALAQRGGVAGLNFYGFFLEGNRESRLEAMVAHIRHMICVGGSDFPAIGTDFDGFDGMELMEIPDIGEMRCLAQALKKAGLTTGQIEKIWFGNAKRVIRDLL